MLKPYASSDFPLLEKWVTSPELLLQFSGTDFSYPITEQQILSYQLLHPDRTFYIGYSQNDIPFAFGEIIPQESGMPRLGRILIGDSKLRGMGFGKYFIRMLIEKCRSAYDCKKVELFVWEKNQMAIKCYKSVGFEYIAEKHNTLVYNGVNYNIHKMIHTFITIFLLLFSFQLQAQDLFTLTGTVHNAKGEPVDAATVFIDGSKKITATNVKGEFTLTNLSSGTYQVVVNMLGYSSVKKDIAIADRPETLNISLLQKAIDLKTVVIGNGSQRKNFLKIFTKYFMGESENAKACKILNTDVIDFSTNQSLVEATSGNFFIIENMKLGYRIKYLLRNFRYNTKTEVTIYDGESIFENMEGTDVQKVEWKANRKNAYEGSLMHYLRSLHRSNTRKEGFLTYAILNFGYPLEVDPNPIITDQIIERIDSNFIAFKYKKRLFTVFDKKKAAEPERLTKRESETRYLEKTGSIFQLDGKIDSKGSYANYKDILIQGFWGRKRIGDQLPLEYDPQTDN
jgi:RimJ/RimL family protein N-acetyltransferase/ribosome-associated protein YbcJ (S4-like RNA binding protein)